MRLLSVILSASMLSVSAVYALSVNAVEFDDNEVQSMQTSEFVLPDIIDENDEETADFVGRVYDEETDLNTFVFENSDGSHIMKVYSHPVKYEDEDGKIKDIALNFSKEADGSFVSTGNNIVTSFSRKLADGIETTYNDVKITLTPDFNAEQGESAVVNCDEESKKLIYQADEKTSYQYSLTYTGYKEDIVVESYTGQNEYDFTLYTNGLSLNEDDGLWYLANQEGEMCVNFGDVIVYSADGNNSTSGFMSSETIVENEEYIITVHVDEDYIRDEATVYPIRIDPSIVVNNGAGGMETTTLFSDDNTPHGSYTGMYVGKVTNARKARSLIKFTSLDLSSIHSSLNVLNARVELYDQLQQPTSTTVYCHQFNGSWSGSGSTWSGLNQNNNANIYDELSSKNVSYSNGVNLTTPHRYKFSVKTAVQRWVDSQSIPANSSEECFRPYRGLIFKTDENTEDGNSINYRIFASCTASSNKPSLTINYTTEIQGSNMYSKYDPIKYNYNTSTEFVEPPSQPSYLLSRNIKYRMNCYGYSFRHIFDGYRDGSVRNYGYGWYKQQPGDFVSNGDMSSVFSHHDLIELNDPGSSMDNIVENLTLDASRLGYSILEYTANSQIPIEQCGTASRMIAIVTGNTDYHFYMQNSDGTWSHKPGSAEISNLSLNNGNNSDILTNYTIYNDANKGDYLNGCLKFFKITRSAIIDYPHSKYVPGVQNTLFYEDLAGDYNEICRDITNGLSGRLDFLKDEDYFRYTPSQSRSYLITPLVDPDSSGVISFCIYNNTGTLLTSGYSNSGCSISLNGGSQYFIRLLCTNDVEYVKYTLQIS